MTQLPSTALRGLLTWSALAVALTACGSDDASSSPVNEDTGVADTDTGVETDTGDEDTDTGVEPDTDEDTVEDTDTDELAQVGEPCVEDLECASEICLRIDPALEEGLCSEACRDDDACPDTWSCVVFSEQGDAEQRCVPTDYCLDEDEDGYGIGPGCAGPDCDDTEALTNPAGDELCDGVDNDCDGTIDDNPSDAGDDCETGFLGVCGAGRTVCNSGLIECEAEMAPSEEACDGLDNDCDGAVDEDDDGEPLTRSCYNGPIGTEGEGACHGGIQTCGVLDETGEADWGTCDGEVVPSAEVCDRQDNDCNGIVDEVDEDGDFYYACPGVVSRDCNDADPGVNPGAIEVCDGIDNNCTLGVDEGLEETFYRDGDGDGFGQSTTTTEACTPPDGYVAEGGDCNDFNASIYPFALEVCDDLDNDCDALVDEDVELVATYVDGDGDGAGAGLAVEHCLYDRDGDGVYTDPPVGRVLNADDCNDSSELVAPGAEELCDSVDNDCDGRIDPWCGVDCGGSWPIVLPSDGTGLAVVGDMNQDGFREVAYTNSGDATLASSEGVPLLEMSGGGAYNYARRPGVFVDLDGSYSDTRGFDLEWFFGPGSDATYVSMDGSGNVQAHTIPTEVYDAGTFLAADVNRDGRSETVVVDWAGNIHVFGLDSGSSDLVERVMVDTDDNIYTNGMLLADYDMDGEMEVIAGEGYARAHVPSTWDNEIRAWSFDSSTEPWTYGDDCPGCFDADSDGLFGASVPQLLCLDDGAGNMTLQALVTYGETDVPDTSNTMITRDWEFDGMGAPLVELTEDTICVPFDTTGDGIADCMSTSTWLHDADGDGDQDRVVVAGGNVHIERWEGDTFARMPGEPFAAGDSGSIRWLGDLDSDGRLNALVATSGRLDCIEFGEDTYHPWTSFGEPLRWQGFDRTMQLDNWEPNNTAEAAYSLRNEEIVMRGYISHADDVDWYQIHSAYCPRFTVQAPPSYGLQVNQYVLEGGSYVLVGEHTAAPGGRISTLCGGTIRPGGTSIIGYRKHHFYEVIATDGGFSTFDPYRAQVTF